MRLLTDIRLYLVIVTLSFLGLLINYTNLKDEHTKCKTDNSFLPGGDIQKANMQEKIDSLNSEIFVLQTINGRYEVALELFKEKNKKGADEFELILTTQTE